MEFPSQERASRRSSAVQATGANAPADPSTDRALEAEMRELRAQLMQAASWTLDRDDAEDACQEALGRSWGALKTGRFPAHDLRRYTFAVLRNVLHEAWRGLNRERADGCLQNMEVEDRRPDALTTLVREETRHRLRSAIDGLPAIQREVIVFSALGGMSCESLSATRGVPAATLRQRKRRALENLARQLHEA